MSYIQLHPLHWLEIKDQIPQNTHWLVGGLPQSLSGVADNQSFSWRDNLIRTFSERDLPQLGLKVNARRIRRFLTMLASGHGEIWNASSYARSLGVSSPTANKYLKYLESAFLATLLKPWSLQTSKRLVKAPKVYISDSGLLHTLLQIESLEELDNHIIRGSSWEGYVIAQIQSILDRKAEVFFYRTHQGAQVDLLIVRGGRPVMAIDIYTTDDPKPTKSFRTAIKDLGTIENFFVTPSSASYQLTPTIQVINLEEFLKLLMGSFHRRRSSEGVEGVSTGI